VAVKNGQKVKTKNAAATKFSLTQQQTDAVEGKHLTGAFETRFWS